MDGNPQLNQSNKELDAGGLLREANMPELHSAAASCSSTLKYIESLTAAELRANPESLNKLIAIALAPGKAIERVAAVRSLGKIVFDNKLSLESLTCLATGTCPAPAPMELRLQALQIIGQVLEGQEYRDIQASQKGIALGAALAALDDSAAQIRLSAIKILAPAISEPRVYIKVCQFLRPEPNFDKKLRVNFEVRVAAAQVLSHITEIPYVRDTFVQALMKPEPNFEVRLPLIQGLSGLLLNQNYKLRQDDSKALFCIIARSDSTEAVQNRLKFNSLVFKKTNPDRYNEALSLINLRSETQLHDVLQRQPLVHFIYQHAGHKLKDYERPPLIDSTKVWPMHSRYFLNESEIRKMWAERNFDSETRKIIESAIKEELQRYAHELESAKEIQPKVLADLLALFVWTNDRSFHGELAKIKPFVEKLNPDLKCIEGFSIKELYDFYDYNYSQHELKQKREAVGFALREKTRHFDIEIAATTNRKDELKERLSIFQEAIQLKIVTSESITRLAKGLVAYFERDPRGFFESISGIRKTTPQLGSLLSLAIERAPKSKYGSGFEELSLKVLNGDSTDLQEAIVAMEVSVAELKDAEEKEFILKRIEFASSSLHYRFFRTPQGIQNFRHELIDFEQALEKKIIGHAQLVQLGGMLDLLYVETREKVDFLKELKLLSASLSGPIRGLLLHAACEHAPQLKARYSIQELASALIK
jgi:hypothetical protein